MILKQIELLTSFNLHLFGGTRSCVWEITIMSVAASVTFIPGFKHKVVGFHNALYSRR